MGTGRVWPISHILGPSLVSSKAVCQQGPQTRLATTAATHVSRAMPPPTVLLGAACVAGAGVLLLARAIAGGKRATLQEIVIKGLIYRLLTVLSFYLFV